MSETVLRLLVGFERAVEDSPPRGRRQRAPCEPSLRETARFPLDPSLALLYCAFHRIAVSNNDCTMVVVRQEEKPYYAHKVIQRDVLEVIAGCLIQ